MKYTAIDFETATSEYTSVCSLGLCVIEDGEITDKKEILIKPEPFRFNDYNIAIHGITPELVWKRHTFDWYWEEIKPLINGRTVIAHNAMFDVGVLKATLDMFGIEYPDFRYVCTVKLSQKAYPELFSHKLNNLCSQLGITFNHHHAMDDAYACAMVFERILSDFHIDSLEEIEECFNIGVGHIYPGCCEPCTKNKKKKKTAVR